MLICDERMRSGDSSSIIGGLRREARRLIGALLRTNQVTRYLCCTGPPLPTGENLVSSFPKEAV